MHTDELAVAKSRLDEAERVREAYKTVTESRRQAMLAETDPIKQANLRGMLTAARRQLDAASKYAGKARRAYKTLEHAQP